MTSVVTNSQSSKLSPWYRPTISPEHGVYVMLAVSFLTRAAAAQRWTWGTNLALIAVFCALITASAFGVALVKFAFILWQRNWYCTAKIQQVALLETLSSLIFLIVVALSVLPAHLFSS